MNENQMFCYQCEQTAKGTGCTTMGVCGKNPEVATLQDLLIYVLRGISKLSLEIEKIGVENEKTNVFVSEALFATLTNTNFDPDSIVEYIRKAADIRKQLYKKLQTSGQQIETLDKSHNFELEQTKEGLISQGKLFGINSDPKIDPDLHSLQWLLTYGLKGVAAYTHHAYIFGKKDAKVFNFINQGLAAPLDRSLEVNDYINLAMKCGEINIRAMELLDSGNTETYGHPIPTKVPLGTKKGKAILVSGHNLPDLEEILKLSEGKGINVYTHGEMLATHAYPNLKKYPHFYGHYGTAWQNQRKEFQEFPGSILMTTNCIQKPVDNYKNNIFTTGPVSWPGVPHISKDKLSRVVDKALELTGFLSDTNDKYVTVGFGRNAVLGVAGQVIEAVKGGKIKKFLLVGGCDGAKPGRSYYTDFVEKAPSNTIILTLACGKFRFFNKNLGNIEGIPRLLDIGQCNDAYSAVKIAQALADAFNVGINDLPLSIMLSWYEQKAVAILLSLLYLGIKNIRLGPSLPAFITPNILNVLVEKFNIMPITTPEEDMKAIMNA